MTVLTLSLELRSLRLIEFSKEDDHLTIRREEVRFFSRERLHRQHLLQEIEVLLQEIKNWWELSDAPLHCILSSDFALLRVATFETPSRFISTTTLLQRDVRQFLPLPREQVSVAYQEIGMPNSKTARQVAYAAMRSDFLDAIARTIGQAGFGIHKMSILPLSWCSLSTFQEITTPTESRDNFISDYRAEQENLLQEKLLIYLADDTVSFLWISPENILTKTSFYSLGNLNALSFALETELQPLLSFYLKREILPWMHSNDLPKQCWMIGNHSSEKQSTLLALFLHKEFSLSSIHIDPCLLLTSTTDATESFIQKVISRILPESLLTVQNRDDFISNYEKEKDNLRQIASPQKVEYERLRSLNDQQELPWISIRKGKWSWKHFFKEAHIISIHKFTAPSLAQLRRQQWTFLVIYTTTLLLTLLSPLSLWHDYVANRKIAVEQLKASASLKQRQLELDELRRHVQELSEAKAFQDKLKELQVAHDKWPLLISELQKCAPLRGIWITQLTPGSKKIKEGPSPSEIKFLEIKGLYLEGIKGEELLHEYADKLARSPLFLSSKGESLIFACAQEDGTAYAYPFTLHLPLHVPIK